MARSRAPGPLKMAISDVPSSSNFSTRQSPVRQDGEFLRPRARDGKAQGFRQFSGVAISFKTSNPLILLDSRIRG
jgi:hypothetical protein